MNWNSDEFFAKQIFVTVYIILLYYREKIPGSDIAAEGTITDHATTLQPPTFIQ